jgi:hypothetical protein
MCKNLIAACSCQVDQKHSAKVYDDMKHKIDSTFNSRGQLHLINMTAYPDGT